MLAGVDMCNVCSEAPGDMHPPAELVAWVPPFRGHDTHLTTTSIAISNFFFECQRQYPLCFRCGQIGHMRQTCFTHKVRLCNDNMRLAGSCSAGDRCTFAHSRDELRTPWKQRCVRVVRQNGYYVCLGCDSSEHTFRKCPLHRDLVFM